MGRHAKKVITEDGVDRRSSGYYATPGFVADFIAEAMLQINPAGNCVLDPCVGKEELLGTFYAAGKEIHSLDVVDYGVHQKASFAQVDFLSFYRDQCERCLLDQKPALPYDYYIANPPYNCHEVGYIRRNKRRLKALFPGVGVSNMYSMFISAMICLAKPGAVIGLISYDSFLTSRMHEQLRRQILRECTIRHLLLCPNDLFRNQKADVRTCIMVLTKGSGSGGRILTMDRPHNTTEFKQKLRDGAFEESLLSGMLLSGPKDRSELVVGCPSEILRCFQYPRLGELCRCVTGISTGNDRKYLRPVADEKYRIPFYKNPGSRMFYADPDGYLPEGFLDIEKRVKNFMVRNRDVLFREGISCSSMGVPFGACYRPEGSTYGVNANIVCDSDDIWWLLSYLNSSLVTYLVRGVMLRTNMITSGYVSRIPVVPLDSDEKRTLSDIARNAVNERTPREQHMGLVLQIDDILFRSIDLSREVAQTLKAFRQNLLRAT